MKSLGLAALAILVLRFPAQVPESTAVVVLLDTDAPAADPVAAAHLRVQALNSLPDRVNVLYYDLRSASANPVAGHAKDSFRRTIFDVQAPTYSGISVDFVEASEIARKNEAVRDTVIRRECTRLRVSDCGGAVHAAATAVLAEAEMASARKLRWVAGVASQHAGGSLVVLTAGWPYRDESRLGFDGVLDQIRTAAVRMVILHVPSAIRYGGLVKDAAETLATRLPAVSAELSREEDIPRARAELASLFPPEPLATRPFLASGLIELPAARQTVTARQVDDVLDLASAYVARFERAFSSIIWRERYSQEERVRRRFEASGGSFWMVAGRRTLDSELLFVWLPVDASWIAVRDVIAVDGQAIPVDRRRLPPLLTASSLSVSQLRQLASENGRFNVGTIVHTFNEPTLALLFLDETYRHRFAFTRRREQSAAGDRVVTYEFAERVVPTVVRDGDLDVPVRGMLWIDSSTGSVVRTSLQLVHPSARLRGTMTVEYGRHPRFDVLVPTAMQETYSSADEEVTTRATYSDFRRFETGGRLILTK